MNDHQLLCFLTVQRTLNFTAAAKELYCTQPALSYQIRSLEKELDLTLFERSTTRVVLTAAGRAFVPHAEQLYRGILNARTALKGFSAGHTLTLRLPPVTTMALMSFKRPMLMSMAGTDLSQLAMNTPPS